MPEMDGYELARRVRQEEARDGRPRTTMIACTANALGGEVDKCFEAGMDDYLAKPVDLARLGEKLGRWLPIPPHPDGVVLDPSVLAEISGGDSSLEREIILRFHGENVADAQALERALRANELEELTRWAHRMKGAARTVGAKRLAAACESLELAGRSSDRAGIEANLGEFHEALARLDAHVHHLRAAGA
jgi:HPt (histidine-containing phosphotransfer) domain-containing protein